MDRDNVNAGWGELENGNGRIGCGCLYFVILFILIILAVFFR